MWGVVGILPAVLMALAFSRAKKKGTTGLSNFLMVPAILYVPTAISLIFFPSNDLASKFPGVVGFGLLFGLITFYASANRLLRRFLNGVFGVILVTLILIPNEYWKIPFLSFERVEFVDNVAPKRPVEILPSQSVSKGWLALEDGRHLYVQSVDELGRNSSGEPVFPFGEAVVLQATSSPDAGQWFDVSYFSRHYLYAGSAVYKKARYVIPLHTRSENMYRQHGTSVAILMDDTADIDYEKMLSELLRARNGWGVDPISSDIANVTYWLKIVTELADIDMQSPEFLSRAYRGKENRHRFKTLVDAGVSPDTVDRNGNTMLHIAAREGDFYSVEWLLELGADPKLINKKRQTALDVAKIQFKTNPARIRKLEALLESRVDSNEPVT